MKVFEIRGDWGFDHLQLGTRPDPKPGPGEVLLRMKAASLNYRDLVVPNRGYGAFTGNLPLTGFLALGSIIIAVPTVKGVARFANDVPRLIPYMGRNVVIIILTPVLLAIGLFIGR